MFNSASFSFSLKENWLDSLDTLRSHLLVLFYAEKRRKNEQNATEKLKHTLAKLNRSRTPIGQKCPKTEVNWQMDPTFACKQNLSGKK